MSIGQVGGTKKVLDLIFHCNILHINMLGFLINVVLIVIHANGCRNCAWHHLISFGHLVCALIWGSGL